MQKPKHRKMKLSPPAGEDSSKDNKSSNNGIKLLFIVTIELLFISHPRKFKQRWLKPVLLPAGLGWVERGMEQLVASHHSLIRACG